MKNLEVFPVQEVSQRTQDFLEDAAQGKLVLLTYHEQPTFLAVPFNERLLEYGLERVMALNLFETGLLTLSQAARLAALSLEDFIELLGQTGIPVADYPPEELDEDVRRASL